MKQTIFLLRLITMFYVIRLCDKTLSWSFKLIESLAENIARELLKIEAVQACKVGV